MTKIKNLWLALVAFFMLTPGIGFSMEDSQEGQLQVQDQEVANSGQDNEADNDKEAEKRKNPKLKEREEEDEDEGLGICPGGVCVPDGELKDE